MPNLELHQNAHEFRFASEELIRFKTSARTARLFGLWAGTMLSLNGEALEAYADEIISILVANASFNTLFEKIAADLARQEILMTRAELNQHYDAFFKQTAFELRVLS
jgi:hypothetical protein